MENIIKLAIVLGISPMIVLLLMSIFENSCLNRLLDTIILIELIIILIITICMKDYGEEHIKKHKKKRR